MANRIHIAYIWHGNQPAWRRQLDLVQPHDIVVLNPSDGPWPDDGGERRDVINLVQRIRAKQATVLGYVNIRWGERDILGVLRDAQEWWSTYGVGRLFVDQVHNNITIGEIAALQRLCASTWLTAHAKINLVLNPGQLLARMPSAMRSGVLVVTSEGPAVPLRDWQPWEAAIANAAIGRNMLGPKWQAWSWDQTPDENPYDGE